MDRAIIDILKYFYIKIDGILIFFSRIIIVSKLANIQAMQETILSLMVQPSRPKTTRTMERWEIVQLSGLELGGIKVGSAIPLEAIWMD